VRRGIWALIPILLVVALSGCMGEIIDPLPPAPPPIPPTPPPVPEPSGLERATFEAVEVGMKTDEVLASLPAPHRETTMSSGKTIYAWRLDEQRPSGGSVWWEVHSVSGTVTETLAW